MTRSLQAYLLIGATALLPVGCDKNQPPADAQAEDEHYCLDEAQWAEWDKLLAKYPTDEDIITLYALRSGLCGMVLKGRVETRTAVRLFDRAHQIVIGKVIDQNAAGQRLEEM